MRMALLLAVVGFLILALAPAEAGGVVVGCATGGIGAGVSSRIWSVSPMSAKGLGSTGWPSTSAGPESVPTGLPPANGGTGTRSSVTDDR